MADNNEALLKLFDPPDPQQQPQAPQTPADTQRLLALFDGPAPAAPQAPSEFPNGYDESSGANVDPQGLGARVLSDIGIGITELPRAIVKGGRDAVQETMDTGADALGYATGSDVKAPKLPDLDKPTSTTGQLATSVSQFVVGMIGLGKITKPIQAVGRGAKIVKESAKAATVGAVAFDPHGKRFSDLINDNLPILSNPVTRYLAADPADSKALGRVKNALESIGLDAVLIGSVVAGAKLFKALRGGDPKEIAAAVEEAQRAEARGAANDVRGNDREPPATGGNEPSGAGASGSGTGVAEVPASQAAAVEGQVPGGVVGETAPVAANDSTVQGLWRHGPPRSELSHTGTADLEVTSGLGGGDTQRAFDFITPTLTDIDKQRLWSLSDKERNARLDAAMRAAAEEGYYVHSLSDDVRVSKWTGSEWAPSGGEHGSRAVDELIALQFNKTMGRTVTPAEFDARFARSREGLPDKLSASRAVEFSQDSLERDLAALGQTTKRVDSVTQGAPPEGVTPKPSIIDVTPEQTASLIKSLKADADAVQAAGSWEAAVSDGYRFGRGERIPWQKLASEPDSPTTSGLEAFIARVADELQAPLNAARGGNPKTGVMSDAQVDRMVRQRATLWGEDPAALMGLLQMAGKNAKSMAANMEAGFLVGQRAMQDAYTMALRIKAGDLSNGGPAELQQLLGVASTLFGQAQAMRASAGRSMRRMRAEFAPSPADIDAIKGLDPSKLVDAVVATGGDAKLVKVLLKPGIMKQLADSGQFLLVNNLLWGLRTHFVNFSTNLYMVGFRPMEKVLGSPLIGGNEGQRIRSETWRQYAAIGSTLNDSWQTAKDAWVQGDSIIAPHRTEAFTQGLNAADFNLRPWDSASNVLYNTLAVPAVKVIGTPTRALGVADELMKNVVYRSKVIARAQGEGAELGLKGDDLSNFVREKLLKSFDDEGRGVDLAALQEAKTAAFQQDLLPGTLGKSVQDFAANQPWMRFIVPFIRTPSNVFRYGIKMTPGLNILQTEYRQMLTGRMGPDAQAHAVGQMGLGGLFMATAAYLAHSGSITGGGPSERQAKAALMATGWQPYSFIREGKNGEKVYIPYNRYDPVAMPFGIIADVVDAMGHAEEGNDVAEKISAASLALGVSLAKQFANKTYLLSLSQAMDAIMDPDRSFGRYSRQMVSNFVPLSSGLRMVNSDPYLRETRDLVDAIKATIPGFSQTLPARRDAFGDPLHVNKGLWVTGDKDFVDREIARMVQDSGHYIGPPSPTIGDVDLRDITMKDGRNAYEAYQTLAAKPSPNAPSLKETVSTIMQTAAYRNAPDGDAAVKGTKLWMLAGALSKYRESALKRVKADPNVMEAIGQRSADVRAYYTAATAPKTPQQEARSALQRIGDAFGVDLNPR